ncbi:MAG: ribose-5-phosphate isomerase RpiA [Gammaproteobacteria bacterium]
MDQNSAKKLAAEAAFNYLEDGMRLGVGTGSTVNFFIELLAEHRDRVEAIASSSDASTALLESHGLTVSDLNDVGTLDLYVDGADEANKHLHLLKGGGGALTREKILAAAARKFVCIADESKLVGVLGSFPLPVEVIPLAQSYVARQMIKAGGQPIIRADFVTDNGNHILDVHNLRMTNPVEMETRFNQIPGVVSVGIFANRPANVLLIGAADGVRTIE